MTSIYSDISIWETNYPTTAHIDLTTDVKIWNANVTHMSEWKIIVSCVNRYGDGCEIKITLQTLYTSRSYVDIDLISFRLSEPLGSDLRQTQSYWHNNILKPLRTNLIMSYYSSFIRNLYTLLPHRASSQFALMVMKKIRARIWSMRNYLFPYY